MQRMRISREQLEVCAFAKKKDEKSVDLTQIQIEASGRASATNGNAIAIIERDLANGDKSGRAFRALVPTNVARTVLDQQKREGYGTAELVKENDGPTFYVKDVEDESDEGLVTRFHPKSDTWPNGVIDALAKVQRTGVRARVALDSHLLATLAGLRQKVGAKGPIKFEVRGELDPVIASWNDDKGHNVLVVLMPSKLEAYEWEAGKMDRHASADEDDEGGDASDSETTNEDDSFEPAPLPDDLKPAAAKKPRAKKKRK